MFKRRSQDAEALRWSFCRKSQDSVRKLISSPTEDPIRACICDECVVVCVSILDDERKNAEGAARNEAGEPRPLSDRPLTAELLSAIERWIGAESSGANAGGELAEVRTIAARWLHAGRSGE